MKKPKINKKNIYSFNKRKENKNTRNKVNKSSSKNIKLEEKIIQNLKKLIDKA